MATANEFALVTQLTGQAWVRGQNGELTPLREGMRVPADAEIVTADGSSVQLQIDGVPPLTISADRTVQLASEMSAAQPDAAQEAISEPGSARLGELASVLDQGQDPFEELDPTAATLAGGGGDGNGFVRLLSVLEPVRPLGLEYPRPGGAPDELPRLPGGIGGNNQNPQALLPASLSLTHNDSQTIAPVNLAQYFNDADGDALTYTATGLPPGLSIHPVTGEVSGTLDKSASQGGSNGVYTVVVTVTDPAGGSATLTFPWTALNPPPVAEDDTNTTEENTVVTGNVLTGGPSGAGQDSDPDGDAIVVTEIINAGGDKVPAGSPIMGDNGGSFVIHPDGSYTFTPGTTFDYLAVGESTTTRVTYTISDGEGGTDTAELIITITGSNDGPTIVSAGTDAATSVTEIADNATGENATEHSRTGSIQFADLDTSDTHTASFQPVATGYLGTFALGAVDDAGNTVGWTFKVEDSAIDHLAAGQTLTQEYDVTVDDGQGGTTVQRVTVTIIGTNDAPVITSAAHDVTVTEVADGAANENTEVHRVGGDILFADVDLTDGHTVALQSKNTGYLGNFQVGAIDAATKTVSWDFKLLDGDIDSLAKDQELVQVYTVTITDTAGATTTQDVTVRIVGTNDAPIMSGETTGAVKEDGITSVSGQLDKADVDLTDTHTWTLADSGKGEYGNFTIDQTGKWTYNLTNSDPRVQALKEGEQLQDKILVTVTDPHGATDTKEVVVTITGTNDGPEVVPPVPGSLDQTHDDSETIVPVDMSPYFKDVDGEKLTYSADGLPPGLSIDKDTGIISGTLDKSASQGGANGVYTVVVTVKDPSGASTTLQFPWKALNPPPVAQDDANTTEENTAVSGNVLTGDAGGVGQDSDPDGDAIKVTEIVNAGGDKVPAGSPITGDKGGSFVINADGSYVFTPGTTFDYLADGETTTTRVTYTISDNEGGTDTAELVITITGTNDVPVFSGSDAGSVTEDVDVQAGKLVETGTLVVTDADNGQSAINTAVAPVASAGALGSLVIDANGNWTYTVDNALVQDMNKDVVRTETFTVTSLDGTTHDITITVTGTNDAPVITSPDSQHQGAVTEDAAQNTASGTLTSEDVDLGHGKTWSIDGSLDGTYGSITLDQNGKWVYTLNNDLAATNALKAGQTVTETFKAVVTDEHGAFDTQDLVITITGNSEAPPSIVPEDTNGGGAINGHVTVDEKGLVEGDNSHIASGSIAIQADDGLQSVTIGGREFMLADLYALAATNQTINLGHGTITLTGFTGTTSVGGIPTAGQLGYTYTLTGKQSHQNAEDLAKNLDIALSVKDAADVERSGTLIVQVLDDAPVAKNDANAVTEGLSSDPAANISGNVLGTAGASVGDVADREGADKAQVTAVSADSAGGTAGTIGAVLQGKFGTLVLNADGTYTYDLDDDNAAVNALKDNGTLTDVFTYTLTDTDGDASTAKLTITINGRTDGVPGIVADDGNGSADGHVTVQEKGLVDNDGSHVVDGTISITAADGLKSIVIGGETFTLLQLQQLSSASPSGEIDVGHGKIVLTGFVTSASVGGVPTAGKISYTYTLSDDQQHKGAEDTARTFDIALSITDAGNDTRTGTLTVQVVDDTPTANDDSASVSSGKFVLDQNGTVLGNDRQGADGAVVTKVSVTTDSGETSKAVPDSGIVTLAGKYGTLSIDANGNYSYVRDPGTPGDVSDVFTYTLTDGDGDVVTAKLTIGIADAGVTIDDLTPAIQGGDVTVQEKYLPDGTATDAGQLTKSGNFTISSPDGIGKLSVGGKDIVLDNVANTPVTIDTGLGNILKITGYDASTGVVSYTYTLAVRSTHADGQDNNDVFEDFTVVLTDRDGDTTSGTLSVRIIDDVPVVTGDLAKLGVITVDESALTTSASVSAKADFSAAFAVAHGADLAATTDGTVYSLAVGAVGSGLKDTATGQDVVLIKAADGTIEGRAGGEHGDLVLTIALDAATGEATLTQLRAVRHADTGNHDDSVKLAAGSVTLTASATDRDGDTASATLNAGGAFTFKDDGPRIELANIDLTQAVVLNTNDADTIGANSGTASTSFAGVFSIASSDGGADGQQGAIAWKYTLGIEGDSASGLTHGGQSIVLSKSGSDIVGKVGSKTIFSIAVDATGKVTLTQFEAIDHPTDSHTETVSLAGKISLTGSATITDRDGDKATSDKVAQIGDKFTFTDQGPSIGNPESATVYEKYLSWGSEGGKPEATTIVKGSLAVSFGADLMSGKDTVFTNDAITALQNMGLTSGKAALTYTLTDSHTITATAGGKEVFVVIIQNPATNPTYQFTLTAALDHVSGGVAVSEQDLTIPFTVKDSDGDTASKEFTVKVTDDIQGATQSITTDEDTPHTFNTTADGTQTSVTIGTGADAPKHGTVSVDVNGKITYKPTGDYSGPDRFTYTTNENGVETTTIVSVTVKPISDAPEFGRDAASVQTDEDVAKALGLKAPVVKDATDQSGSDTDDHDRPELLSVITLTGIPTGAKLIADAAGGSAAVDVSVTGEVRIVLSDAPHVSNISGTYITMTKAQFEALKVLPPAEKHQNFTVTAKVTSHEVDGDGVPLTGVDGATTTTTVKVNVQAVTDPVELTIDGGKTSHTVSMDEDGTFDLKTLLTVEYPNSDGNNTPDTDGSEKRWFEISGLPVGSYVNGQEVTSLDQVITVQAPALSTTTTGIPALDIKPPKDFSGDITAKVTLVARDQDSDGIGSGATQGDREESSITLTLHVKPQGGDVAVGNSDILEDHSAAFLSSLVVTDTGTGNEVITDIVIKGIPAGWVLKDGDTVLLTGDGAADYTVTNVEGGAWKQYTLTPPAHSSKDETIRVEVTTRDTNTVNGAVVHHDKTVPLDIKITVEAVAEIIPEQGQSGGDTDGNNVPDLTMTKGYVYTEQEGKVNEDNWFSLNTANFDLGKDWKNEDAVGQPNGSEQTFALLKPVLVNGVAGETAAGAQFRYTDAANKTHTLTYDGGAKGVQIPIEFLDTVEFLPPANVSGTFKIDVQARTIDTDPDGGTVTADSGHAELEGIVVAPVADKVTLSVGGTSGSAYGNEDTFIGLSIRPTSSDKSETFNVRIGDIPPGATLKYDGNELDLNNPTSLPVGITVVSEGGKTWLQINNFDQSKDLAIKPPLNSNEDFKLTVQSQSVDAVPGQTGESKSDWGAAEMPLPVRVKGVADSATLDTATPTYAEQALDDGDNSIALKDLVTGYTLEDGTDGSETLSLKITGLADGFTVVGATFLGGSGTEREWVLTSDQLSSGAVKIVVPEHYSGEVKAKVIPITTENDGDWAQSDAKDIKAIITPSPESTGTPSSSVTEDTLSKLTFAVVHNGDTDETLGKVYIKAADVDGKDGFTIFLGENGPALKDANLTLENGYYVLEQAQYDNLYAKTSPNFAHNLADADELKFGVKYEIIDPYTDGSNTTPVTKIIEADHKLVVTPVTDPVKATLDGFTGDASIVTSNGDTVVLSDRGTFNVNLDLSKLNDANADNLPDYDGSEKLISVYVSGVPNGLNVTGLVVDGVSMGSISMIGNGVWVIALPAASYPSFTGAIDATVQFEAGPFLANVNQWPITITVGTQDTDAATVASDSVTWKLDATGEGPGTQPSTQLDFKPNDSFTATEDAPFTMDQAFDASLSEDAKLSLVLELPVGATVTYQGQPVLPTTIVGDDGQPREIWVVNGQGTAGSDLVDFLSEVQITPPANWNDGRGDNFIIDATLTAHSPNGSQAQVDVDAHQVPVDPVTDEADITVTFGVPDADGKTTSEAPKEGKDVAIQLSVGSSVDGPTTIGDVVYVQVSESADFSGGKVYTADAYANNEGPLVLQTLGADNPLGLPAGDYYVLPVAEADRQLDQGERLPVDLVYVPDGDKKYVAGSVKVDAWVANTEKDSDQTKTGSGSGQTTLEGVDNEYELKVGTEDGNGTWIVGGDENQSSTPGDGKIQLDVKGNLLDTDSEQVYAAFIKGLPNGFLVYVGNDAASATTAVLANNAGNSVWNIPIGSDGKLPAYIAVVPPQNWSGTLPGVNLVVQSGEVGSTQPPKETTKPFNLVVDAKADGLTSLTPQQAFGDEGDIIRLQLNAVMKDGVKVGETDGSVETVTLTLKGLGDHAAFYTGSNTLLNGIAGKVVYDDVNDIYTITGLSQADVDTLGVIQAAGAAQGQVIVTAQTVESLGGDPSETKTSTFDMSIFDQRATSGDDTLLFDGKTLLDGGDGEDTVWLRFGENMDFSAVKDSLDNIETIDLTREGFAHELSNLGVEEVKAMTTAGTDGSYKLTIKADDNDVISFKADESWVRDETKSTAAGHDVYTSSQPGADKVEVHIQSQAGSAATIAGVLEDEGSSINGLLGGASAKAASAPAPASAPLAYDASNQIANDLIQQGKLQSDI